MENSANLTPISEWDIPCTSGEPLHVSLKSRRMPLCSGAERLRKISPDSTPYVLAPGSEHSAYLGPPPNMARLWKQTLLGDKASGDLPKYPNPLGRRQFEENSTNRERSNEARWRDYDSQQKQSAVLFDLVAKDNTRARSVTRFVDGKDLEGAAKRAAESKSAFTELNDLLTLGTLLIALENSKDEEIIEIGLAKHRNASASYSIAQMSDGERNAATIGATVLTVEPGTALLIDEPERHLHRSIIVPFLTAVFANRQDCTFVISTHELALPASNPAAAVLMVRSCEWQNNRASAWDIDVLESNELPESTRVSMPDQIRSGDFRLAA